MLGDSQKRKWKAINFKRELVYVCKNGVEWWPSFPFCLVLGLASKCPSSTCEQNLGKNRKSFGFCDTHKERRTAEEYRESELWAAFGGLITFLAFFPGLSTTSADVKTRQNPSSLKPTRGFEFEAAQNSFVKVIIPASEWPPPRRLLKYGKSPFFVTRVWLWLLAKFPTKHHVGRKQNKQAHAFSQCRCFLPLFCISLSTLARLPSLYFHVKKRKTRLPDRNF